MFMYFCVPICLTLKKTSDTQGRSVHLLLVKRRNITLYLPIFAFCWEVCLFPEALKTVYSVLIVFAKSAKHFKPWIYMNANILNCFSPFCECLNNPIWSNVHGTTNLCRIILRRPHIFLVSLDNAEKMSNVFIHLKSLFTRGIWGFKTHITLN